MTMVERVARVLVALEYPEQSEAWINQVWREYVPAARAVIEAMREPSETMHAAVMTMLNKNNWYIDCGEDDIWPAMIDAALSEHSA